MNQQRFPRSVKITSEQGQTKVVDAVTGLLIPNVMSITVRIDPQTLEAHLMIRPIEMQTDGIAARFYIPDPKTGEPKEVTYIQFMDGTRWDPNIQGSSILKPVN